DYYCAIGHSSGEYMF
nr:immunoglobulin light chain junction region [Macaca mulatta]MOX17784.1 immunoglobulin light chain junction region [Macaca mulatta]MOX18329.1 immunoglobulin light chain junction region [Macaca mulatta]MOX18413.1 immunoglobulin light chain junction region [Macaca mulatta]MOX18574.1 immunoglobulin light chain junction region [Macaca mulatta]